MQQSITFSMAALVMSIGNFLHVLLSGKDMSWLRPIAGCLKSKQSSITTAIVVEECS